MITFDEMDQAASLAQVQENWGLEIPLREIETKRQRLLESLLSDPLLRRYLDYRKTRDRNAAAWHAVGEQRVAALGILAAEKEIPGYHLWHGCPEVLRISIAYYVLRATPYLWMMPIEVIAQEAPLPPHRVSREILPYPVIFWSFETSIRKGEVSTDWMLLSYIGEKIRTLAPVMERGSTEGRFVVGEMGLNLNYPHDYRDEELPGVSQVLKRCAFLNSKYVTATPRPVERIIRRQLGRKGVKEIPEVAVVQLRHAEHQSRRPAGEAEEREWAGRWWVSGHYRAQWMPSKQAHEVRWIAPYLKGPEDKPIIPRVYHVNR